MEILIVEDDLTSRAMLSIMLTQLGHEVVACEDGEEAYEALQNKDTLRLAVLDWMMPELSGIEFCKKVRKQSETKYVFIIMLTSKTEHENVIAGYEAGVDFFMKKPPNIELLQRMITVGERIISLHQNLCKEKEKTEEFAREMETLANERAKQLVFADRMVTLGTMSAGIAHEINNPTTFISGNAQSFETFWPFIEQLIREKGKESPVSDKLNFIRKEAPQIISGIKEGADRITRIVQSLKTFAHHSDTQGHEAFNLSEVITNALVLCHNKVKYNIDVVKNIDRDIPFLFGDRQQIEQVIVNIINNASDALSSQDDGRILISAWCEEGYVSIKIADNGPGIKQEHLDQIFNPFFTTKPVGKGTGLGMSISFGIIGAHKGALEAGNNSDKGAFFHIILPAGGKKESKMGDKNRATILVVDDEEEIRGMLSRHFRFLGYNVLEAENGLEALEVLGKNRIEVVITDLKMPKMNGEELLKRIRTEYPMVQRIVITGYVKLENLLTAMKYGATTCIFKPINELKELEAAVESAIRHLQRWQKKFLYLQSLKA